MATRKKPASRAPKKKAAAPKKRQPSVVVVGFGRVGGALALGLRRAGWPVSVLPRSSEAVRRAAQLGIGLADLESLRTADLCILAVPDAAVPSAAALVREDLRPSCGIVHCSGALPLTALGTDDAPVASFHPLVAVSDAKDSLAGHAVAIAATDEGLSEHLTRMAEALGLKPFEVPETGRAAYHAGAVLSAGLLVALADVAVSAFELAGLERQRALDALVPLMYSALRGAETRGLERSLTGPVVRGDVAVVQAHLEALPPELGAVYRLLSRRALGLATSLPAETRSALARLLA